MTNKKLGTGSGMRSRASANRPRQSVASKELLEARRKKRQREVLRNRIIFGLICTIVLALLIVIIVKLFGSLIGTGKMADTSTLTFCEDGQVVFEEVTDFDSEVYSKSEFKTYAKDLVESFNETYGEDAIKINKLKVAGEKAYIKTTYKDADCYEAFTSCETYSGDYEGAVSAGYDFGEQFMTVSDGHTSEPQVVDAASLFAGVHVAIIKKNVTVNVPDTIKYVSNANIEIIDVDTVSISQKDGNSDATDLVYIIY